MEIHELRYFVCAAKHQNIQKASLDLHVSAGSISKSISSLENELGVDLFERVGRSVQLTEHGRLLQRRASEILLLLEESVREIGGKAEALNISIAGSEILIYKYAIDFVKELRKKFANLIVRFDTHVTEEQALIRVKRGEATFAFTSIDPDDDLESCLVGNSTFQTVLSTSHPLYRENKSLTLTVQEVLTYGFVCPEMGMLGKLEGKLSADGWRDDKFPRRVEFVASRLKLLERIVHDGLALAYLPDFFVALSKFKVVKVTNCPYVCKQKIRMVASKKLLPYTLRYLF